MEKTQIEKFVEDPESMRLYQQERVLLETTERICDAMEERGMTRVDLSKALGKSKGFVSQLLNGNHNMTLRTVSDVFLAIGLAVQLQTSSLESTYKSPVGLVCGQWEDENNSMTTSFVNEELTEKLIA